MYPCDIKNAEMDANGQVLAQHDYETTPDEYYFYLHDRLGSVRILIDTAGTVLRSYTYGPFGEVLEEFAEDDPAAPSNSLMFTGQWFDSEIGQYYLRARMYDPQICRFTSRDPVTGKFENPLSLHKYLYCQNDPVNRLDPRGLWAVATWLGHPHLTYSSLRQAGFSSEDMYFGVLGSIATDYREDHMESFWSLVRGEDYHTGNIPHYGPGYADVAQAHAEGALELAIWYKLQGQHEYAMLMLGMGIHTIQDRWAHFEQGAGWGPHFPGGANPDDPYENILEYLCALEESRKYIELFNTSIEKGVYDLDESGTVGNGYIDSIIDWDKTIQTMRKYERRLLW